MLLLAWFIATCLFTIDANKVEGIENNIAADIVAAILLFNLIPWLITYRRWRKRKKEKEKALNPARSFDENYVAPFRSIRRTNVGFAISLLVVAVIAGGIYQWSAQQIANLEDSPTPTYLDSFEAGEVGKQISWLQVAKRNKAPLTWHTCDQIKVFVNPGVVKTAVDDVKVAIDEINELTGLKFYYAGFTTKQPFVDSKDLNEVYVGFYSEDQAPDGFKFGKAIGLGGGEGGPSLTAGNIAIRVPAYTKANKALRKEVLLHEFGHVLGLNHVSVNRDLMAPTSDGTIVKFNKRVVEYFQTNPGCMTK